MLPESGGNALTGCLNLTLKEKKPSKAGTVTNKEAIVHLLVLARMGKIWSFFSFDNVHMFMYFQTWLESGLVLSVSAMAKE